MKRLLLVMAAVTMAMCMTGVSTAGVNVSIGVDIPVLRFSSAPDVVVVPSGDAYVYMVPDTPGIYFYGGYWYRVYDDRWYRSRAYNGRWAYIDPSIVPEVVVAVPPDYSLYLPSDYLRIRYGNFNRSWKSWDRDRHWNRYDWYKNERRDDIRRGRMEHLERERGLHRDDRRGDGHRPGRDHDRRPEMDRRPPRDGQRHDDSRPKTKDDVHKRFDGPQG